MLYLVITIVYFIYLGLLIHYRYRRIYYVSLSFTQFRDLRHRMSMEMSNALLEHKPIKNHKSCLKALKAVDKNIRRFGHMSAHLTKFGSLKKTSQTSPTQIVKAIFNSSKNLKRLKEAQTSDLESYVHEYNTGVRLLFEAIPFLRIRLVFWFARTLLPLVIKIGWRNLTITLNNLIQLEVIEKTVFGKYSL